MKKTEYLNYKVAAGLNMLDVKRNIVNKMNVFALIAVLVSSVAGTIVNYVLRMSGQSGGFYTLYFFAGLLLCIAYMYLHEFVHAIGILLVKGERPNIKFGKIAAWCGSPTITFNKAQYFFVASLPLVFFCALLIPLTVFLPPVFFPLAFLPLTYNVFGSMGDIYMICRAMKISSKGLIVDEGTTVRLYLPVQLD